MSDWEQFLRIETLFTAEVYSHYYSGTGYIILKVQVS